MKTSFSFRRSWLDAINMINDAALRAEITAAVVNYGLTGELTPSDSDIVNAIVTLIISQIPRKRDAAKPPVTKPVADAEEPATNHVEEKHFFPESHAYGTFADENLHTRLYPFPGYPDIQFYGPTNKSNIAARRKLVDDLLPYDRHKLNGTEAAGSPPLPT